MTTRMRSIAILLFLTVFLFILSPRIARAETCNWTGGSGDWNETSHWSCGHVPGPGDEATIDTLTIVTVTLTEDAAIGILNLSGGTLTGSFNLTAGTINWSSGTMSGNGSTTATNFANFTGSSINGLDARTFNNTGTATFTKIGTGRLNFINSAIFNNQAGAAFIVQTAGTSILYGTTGSFINAGTVTKSSPGDTNIGLEFNNTATGTLIIQVGMLVMNNSNASTGSVCQVQSDTTLRLTGTHNLSGNITGTGTLEIVGTVNITGTTYAFSGTTSIIPPLGLLNLNVGTTASIGILNMSGGTLTGAGDVTAGTINWSGGTMSGSGSTTATNFANFTGSGINGFDARTFNNTGTATFTKTGTGRLNFINSAIFNNQAGATFTVQSSGTSIIYGQGTFNNYGTLNLTTGNIRVTTFRQEAGGITNLAIGGTTPNTDYSQLNATDFYLTGPLNISFTGGYTPQIPDHFILLVYSSSRTGDFSPVSITPVPGVHWSLYYKDNSLHLVADAGMGSFFMPIIIR